MRPSNARGRALLLAAATALLSACVYRLDTQQGNILDVEQVDQVEVGMTRSQVRFVLGTPMVADPFDQSRWDYVYWQRKGKGGQVWKSQVTVWFDGDQVARIEKPDRPRPPGAEAPAPELAPPAGSADPDESSATAG
jgi:outer membrane protein assembly factor BamE